MKKEISRVVCTSASSALKFELEQSPASTFVSSIHRSSSQRQHRYNRRYTYRGNQHSLSRYTTNPNSHISHFITIVALLSISIFQAPHCAVTVAAASIRHNIRRPNLGSVSSLSLFVTHSHSNPDCNSPNSTSRRNLHRNVASVNFKHQPPYKYKYAPSFQLRTMSSNDNNNESETEKKHDVAIYWFRNALRFHDNPSLLHATQNSKALVPIYIIDPDSPFAQTSGRGAGAIRANFMLESITELQKKLSKKKESKSDMIVLRGKPEDILPKAVQELCATALYYEREPAAPIREMDAKVLDAIDKVNKDIEIQGYDTHTLHPMEHYLAQTKDQLAPSTYGVFTKIFNKMTVPVEVPTVQLESFPPLPSNMDQLTAGLDGNGNKKWKCPTLKELGYDPKDIERRFECGIEFHGGEDAGLKLLKRMMKRTSWVCTFEKPNTSPNALTVDTTGLSAYVKHGCISPRTFYHELTKVYDTFPASKLSKPPVSLHGQLMWREYNNLMGYTTPHFDQMVDNPVARQIPWDDDPKLLEAWKNAQTGYPYIDAIMTQLKHTGWIHHLARHSVACFLTRGDLWQSWEKGAEVFEEELIDADWSINNFNWQWLSCTAHFYQYFRCYSPVAFGKKTDKNGDYIRKWLPQFKNWPTKYIYEPWNAPKTVQEQYGVIIGEDYPEPIVEHKSMSKSNMARMKAAYDAHKAGLSGSAVGNGSGAGADGDSKPPTKKRRRTKK